MQKTHTPLPSYFWSELNTLDFARIDPARTVAVLPVAATEQHGPHLPTGVDSIIADGIVASCVKYLVEREKSDTQVEDNSTGDQKTKLPAIFLPTQQIGKSNEHGAFSGTLSLSAQTTIAVWMDIGTSIAASGVKKLLLLNAHGGQASIMDIVARDLRVAYGLLTFSVNWYDLPLGTAVDGLFSAEEHRFGIHGGDIETSLMLALQPQLVDMAQASNFHSTSQDRASKYLILGNGKTAKMGWQMQDYNAQGAAGNAAAATAKKGRALLDAAGQQLAALLAEVSDLPLATVAGT